MILAATTFCGESQDGPRVDQVMCQHAKLGLAQWGRSVVWVCPECDLGEDEVPAWRHCLGFRGGS